MDDELFQQPIIKQKRIYKTPRVNVIYEEDGVRKCKQYTDITDIVNHIEEIKADSIVSLEPSLFPEAYRKE